MELDGFWVFIFIIVASTIYIFLMTRRRSGKVETEDENGEIIN
jgi:hypothetical protein